MIKIEAYYKAQGAKTWRIGPLGFLLQYWNWLAALPITVIVLLAVFWSTSEAAVFPVNAKVLTIGLVGALGFIFVFGLRYLKYRTIRSLKIKGSLHTLTHQLRDGNTELHTQVKSGDIQDGMGFNEFIQEMLTSACENVAKHFRLLKNSDGINVAIRLAAWSDAEDTVVYETIARSDGFSEGRAKTSEPIPFDTGIPRVLREENDSQGVLIYYDMQKAISDRHTYQPTDNDKKYPNDIQSMMVAPLNAWTGSGEDMLGIIFVTSKNKNTFDAMDIDQFAFVADLVATSIASATDVIELGMLRNTLQGN